MKRIFENWKTAVQHRILSMILVGLISLTGWGAIAISPAFANSASNQALTQTPTSQNVESREEAYEEAKEILNDPQGIEKEYERNLSEYKKEHPGELGIVEQTKEVIERATGNE